MALVGRRPAQTALVSTTALAALMLGAPAPQSALALPEYSVTESKPCSYCHTNPDGGGALTAAGRFYEENNHSLLGYEGGADRREAPPRQPSLLELQARMQELRRQMELLQQQLDAAAGQQPPPRPEAGPVLPPPLPPAPTSTGIRTIVGGYSEFTFRNQSRKKSTFDQLRLVPRFSARLGPRLAFNSEVEFEHGGNVETGGEVALEQAYAEYSLRPSLGFRAGALLVPFNRLNVLHDGPLRELTDRPLVDQYVVPTTWTEAGVGVGGSTRLSRGVGLNYQAQLINGLRGGATPEEGLREARPEGARDNNVNKALVARLGVTALRGLEVGFSGYRGKWDDAGRLPLSMVGADLAYRRGPLKILGEWAKVNIARDAAAAQEGTPPGMNGFYLEASYRLGAWTPVLHFSQVNTDTSQPGFQRSRTVLGVNRRLTESFLLKLEYQWNHKALRDEVGNGIVSSVTHYF